MLSEFSAKLAELVQESCNKCSAKTIAMSGGLDSTILAYCLKDQKPDTIAVISEDFISTDLTYCQLAAKELDLKLSINKATTADILSGVEETIKILKNFNDIEIRNNVVMVLVMNWLKDQGKSSIITGDGADELFAGYAFLQRKTKGQLEDDLKRIKDTMHFPTQKIGTALDIKVESPFLDKKIVEIAEDIPTDLKIKKEGGKIFGKWVLRKAFEGRIPKQIAWREKSPMQDGAGTSGLTELFESLVSDKNFAKKKKDIEDKDGIIIRTKESLHYYELFRKYNEPPNSDGESICPYCKSNVNNSKFCRMCGAFPI